MLLPPLTPIVRTVNTVGFTQMMLRTQYERASASLASLSSRPGRREFVPPACKIRLQSAAQGAKNQLDSF